MPPESAPPQDQPDPPALAAPGWFGARMAARYEQALAKLQFACPPDLLERALDETRERQRTRGYDAAASVESVYDDIARGAWPK